MTDAEIDAAIAALDARWHMFLFGLLVGAIVTALLLVVLT